MLHTSDIELWMRLATLSSIGVVKPVQGYYRWHGANMNAQYGSGVIGDRRQRLEKCERVFKQWGGAKIPFASWIDEVRKAFAREANWLAGERSSGLTMPVIMSAWHLPTRSIRVCEARVSLGA